MKKRYFKRWIDILLINMTALLFMFITVIEYNSIIIDFIIKIISLLLIIINTKLLKKYSRILEEK